jgi:hypothetical protein
MARYTDDISLNTPPSRQYIHTFYKNGTTNFESQLNIVSTPLPKLTFGPNEPVYLYIKQQYTFCDKPREIARDFSLAVEHTVDDVLIEINC